MGERERGAVVGEEKRGLRGLEGHWTFGKARKTDRESEGEGFFLKKKQKKTSPESKTMLNTKEKFLPCSIVQVLSAHSASPQVSKQQSCFC